jgi:hypothetical protein
MDWGKEKRDEPLIGLSPNFLLTLLASPGLMRLFLMKAVHVNSFRAPWQEIWTGPVVFGPRTLVRP